MQTNAPRARARRNSMWALPIFFAISYFLMESVFRVAIYKTFFSVAFIYSTLFGVVAAFFFSFVCTLFKKKDVNYWVAVGIMGVDFLIFAVQLIYFRVFSQPMVTSSLAHPTAAFEYGNIVIKTIFANLPALILMALPLIFLLLFGRRFLNFKCAPLPIKAVLIACLIAAYLLAIFAVGVSGKDSGSPRTLYWRTNNPEMNMETFGVLTFFRLDTKRLVFGFTEKGDFEDPVEPDPSESGSSEPAPSSGEVSSSSVIDYGVNAMDIDFSALAASTSNSTIKDMHEYFASLTPSSKNEMTGIFKDCNFIFITAESFSRYPNMYPQLFPTIHRMVTEGLEFTNYYVSGWSVSTTDGEYVQCTGLIPKNGVRSFKASAKNYMPFCMGNQFSKAGYPKPYAFHNHTHTFYQRDQSHPNMGYNYLAYGNGLEDKIRKTWPESDLEMMQVTLPYYVNENKFHAYYMTVSGHQLYTFTGNYMSKKHKDEVESLNLPETCKAYLAANLELEAALKYLVDELDKAGKLQNTVFVMSADHYPYGLLTEDGGYDNFNAFLGHTVETQFELFKSNLILWKPGMEHREISDPVTALDIMPTISNMFGLEFDSRLFMGRDVFSDAEPIAIFNTRSWITDKCSYNAKTKEVISFTGEQISEDYVKRIQNIVSKKFKYSTLILEQDYYGKLFKK